jgi:hypothetical protein
MLYSFKCVNFRNEIHCILGSAQMAKFHKQTKPSFQGTVHQGRNLKFVIFAEPKTQHILF